MDTKELVEDYIATLCRDAELTYEEQQFLEDGDDDCPCEYEVPQEVIEHAQKSCEKFHAAFPDSTIEGGEIYLESTYAAGGVPLDMLNWICDNIEPLKGTPTIWKNDDGKFEMEVE